MKPAKLFTMSSLILSSVLYAAEGTFHIVKKGETLSEIAMKEFGRPVYEHGGSLEKLTSLNPELKNPHRIFPGQKIALSLDGDRTVAAVGNAESEEPVSIGNAVNAQELPEQEPPVSPEQKTPVQPPAVAGEPSSEATPLSRIGVDLGFSYFRIDSKDKATGADSTLISGMNPETRVTWDLLWNEKWASRLRFAYQSYRITDDTSASPRSMDGASGGLYGFEAGVIRSWSKTSRTGLSATVKERIFEHASTSSSVTIDRVVEPSLKVSQEWDLFHVKSASVGVGASGEAVFPGRGPGYSTETGFASDAMLYLRHEMKNISLQGSVYYGLLRQNSNLVEQSESHVGAAIGLVWRFGE